MSAEAFVYVRSLRLGTPARKLVLQSLADRADEAFSCYPSVPLMAAECELRPRMVQRHMAWLREHGYVSDRERFRPDGSQTSNRYFLHGPWDDYGGTGQPFEQVAYPEREPVDGSFRTGTKAAQGVYSSTPGGAYRSTPSPRTPVRGEGVPQDVPPAYSGAPLDALDDVPRGAPEDTTGVHPNAPLEPPEEASEEAPPPPSVATAEVRAREKQKGAASPRDLSAEPAGGTAGPRPAGGPGGGPGAAATEVHPRYAAMARDVLARLPRWLQPGDEDERAAAVWVIAHYLAKGHPVPDLVRELSGNPPGDQVAAKAAFITARLRRMAPYVPPARHPFDTQVLDEIRQRQAAQADAPPPDTAAARAAMAAARDRLRTSKTQQQEVDGGPADS